MINLKNIWMNTLIGIGLFFIGYFGLNYLLKGNRSPSVVKNTEYSIQKNIIVDSLLIVVDSLQVQVDSLHHARNKKEIVFIPQNIDTALIIEQYYKTYKQEIIHRDKDLDFKLSFDLIQNKIQAPKLVYKILKPVVIIKQKTNHFYVGATLGGSQFELDQFTPELVFFTGKHGFKIGYNLLDQNRNLQIGYYFKIK